MPQYARAVTAECGGLIGLLDDRPPMYASVTRSPREAIMSEAALSRLGRIAPRLSLPLMMLGLLLAATGVRLRFLPAPVTVDPGTSVDVYAWESAVAALLIAAGGLCFALTTKIDSSAPPERMIFRRAGKWAGWIAGVGGVLIAVRLALMLLGFIAFP